MLAASLNAFFCASPIYGSAEDFTFLLDVTVSREVTPAAKQQIGETRKKCNSDDRRQWRKQGGAVGAAASRMRAAAKQTLGAATRLSAATSFFPFRLPLRGLKGASSPFLVDPARRNRWCFSGSLLARKRELSSPQKQFINIKRPSSSLHENLKVFFSYSNNPSGRQTSFFGTLSHEKSLMRLSGVRGAGSSCRP